jgi:eukaryotic-like serine/threonine-protein kinase
MANQPQLVAELFEAVLALKPGEREAFLDRACSHDSALRQTIEDLLAQDARAGSFLQHPPFDFLEQAMRGGGLSGAETVPKQDGNGDPSMRSLVPGQVLIDRFVIVRLIAKGGMGEVYEAEDRFLQGTHVALKTILPRVADEPELQRRFEREVLLARQVIHPNLCPIYDIFHCDQAGSSFVFLTMKLLPGETLAARLRAAPPISGEEGLAILNQAALGLAAIHAAGVVHRDIKPNNIMLDGTGANVRLWITDFGLARALESDTTFSRRGAVAGTPSYIAPELHQGHPPSQASDLYAFGVVMHEVFTGQKPAVAPDSSSLILNPRLNSSSVPSSYSHLVRECLDLDPSRRCMAFEQALTALGLKRRTRKPWTRRQFVGAAAAGVCTLAAGSWFERETIYNLLHPLPDKRFVALLPWPKASDNQVAPMLTGVLTAIKGELARIEALDHDLFVISPEDLPEGDVSQDLTQTASFREVCDPLGANLVLAASGVPGGKYFELLLRVLDPASGHMLRAGALNCNLHDITSLPTRAVQMAASLLNVGHYLKDSERTQPGTQSTAAFTAYQQAETLIKQPNDTGLNAAIEKYKEAIELDPLYAIAHAKLGMAYGRLYAVHGDPAALDLARGNCERALALEPNLADGHLALGLVLEQTGDEQGALDEIAKTLKVDPANPRAMAWEGQIYSRLNRWADAERTLNRVVDERPNSWLAYNEWGVVLNAQGRYSEAIQKFKAASLAAPGTAFIFGNLAGAYLQVGDYELATEAAKKSLALNPNDLAADNVSFALRCQHRFPEALPFAEQAAQMNPAEDTNWLELGECYSSLRNRQSDAKAAYLRAAQEAQKHLNTDATDGPSWMRLALYQVKSGNPQNALALIKKAELLGARDMDSQLYKARILELLGNRDEALSTLAACFRKGATSLQFASFPDMESLRKDPRYQNTLQSRSSTAATN